MSQENVDVILAAIEAVNRQDAEASVAGRLAHPPIAPHAERNEDGQQPANPRQCARQ